MNRTLFFRILLGIVVVAVLVGAGFALFNAGAAYGLSQPGVWAERMGPGMMPRGMPWLGSWHMGWGLRPFGWGFGLLGLIFQILLIVGLIWLVGWLFFGWGRRGNGGRLRAAPTVGAPSGQPSQAVPFGRKPFRG